MKIRLTTLDIVFLIDEIREKLVGCRVDQVYDIDKKTYLIRLVKSKGTSIKYFLLLESGLRFHTTNFEWPKNPAPSGFSMKLRKHLNNKRLEKITQVGADRIVDLQFGIDEAAYHIILELYDSGNVLLTDHEYKILYLVRPHVQGEEKVAMYERYELDNAKKSFSIGFEELKEHLSQNKGKHLRQVLLSKVEFGPALFNHVLKEKGLTPQAKIPNEEDITQFEKLIFDAFESARHILENCSSNGAFITLTNDKFYEEFHPNAIVSSYDESKVLKYETLDQAIDEFFSKVEAQKLEKRQISQEKDALKKLDRVKKDQEKRLEELKSNQELDKKKAELIMLNQELVEKALNSIRLLVANQIDWDEIWTRVKDATAEGDPVASKIVAMNLVKNQFTMLLSHPYEDEEDKIDINLDFSAYANATKYFDLKKASAKKEERTIESQEKAIKSTEKKTLATLKESAIIQSIKKARKIFWFEKFRWFISSENFIVIGGRDAQQNELLVKRYMKPWDIFIHADSHGAPSIIIKNDTGSSTERSFLFPKTLNEAANLALCYSACWETKIISSIWWAWGDQVTKIPPSGEYLPTGSFMIRGKKNYLQASQLVLGFGFLFRLSDECIEKHKNDRPRKLAIEEEMENLSTEVKDEFPDTQVSLNVKSDTETYIISTASNSFSASVPQNRKESKIAEAKAEAKAPPPSELGDELANKPKRGQHGRKKKIKEKYKDQDEEEKELRMKLINPNMGKEMPKEEKEVELPKTKGKGKGPPVKKEPRAPLSNPSAQPEIEEVEVDQETSLLQSLTGSPLEDDELLFAIPVIAPYSTLQGYKFKIKMIPGTSKRGKAARNALETFLRDKGANQREKDLLKSVKDQDLARNFPQSVKLAGAQKG